MKPYDERPWWCQVFPYWLGPPWYAEIEDFDAWLVEVMRRLAQGHPSLAEADAEQQERNDGDAAD
jgi:hypothetical protein